MRTFVNKNIHFDSQGRLFLPSHPPRQLESYSTIYLTDTERRGLARPDQVDLRTLHTLRMGSSIEISGERGTG